MKTDIEQFIKQRPIFIGVVLPTVAIMSAVLFLGGGMLLISAIGGF